jgi:hypothetical protein
MDQRENADSMEPTLMTGAAENADATEPAEWAGIGAARTRAAAMAGKPYRQRQTWKQSKNAQYSVRH